jgi:hypothetical protein
MGDADRKQQFDELLRQIPERSRFKFLRRGPNTREERDDPTRIYNVHSLADLTREVLKRVPDAGRAPKA